MPAPRRSRRPLGLAVAVALALAPVLAGCSSSVETSPAVAAAEPAPAGELLGRQPPAPIALPDLRLTDHSGQPYDLRERAADRVVLLFFGYTNCPDVCPQTMATVASALRQTDPALRERVSVVFVTSDPERDTPRRLASWLRGFDPDGSLNFVGLTGDLDVITREAADVGVPIYPPEHHPDGMVTVAHGAQVTGYDRTGAGRVQWAPDAATADIAHDLPILAGVAG